MTKHFILSGLIATMANLILNAGAYFLFLKRLFEANPPISVEFQRQLVRPPGQLIGWAMVVTSLAMGFFIATVIQWSGARTFVSGLKKGLIVGLLFWGSVNFGLYASSNHFSLVGVWCDLLCSALAMTFASATVAWFLGKRKKF